MSFQLLVPITLLLSYRRLVGAKAIFIFILLGFECRCLSYGIWRFCLTAEYIKQKQIQTQNYNNQALLLLTLFTSGNLISI